MAFEESSSCVLNAIQPAAEFSEGNELVTSLERPVDEGRALEHDQVIDDEVEITCFSEDVHDMILHFQIIRLKKQILVSLPQSILTMIWGKRNGQKSIYAWIGCNCAKFGHLYAAAATRPNNIVSVTSILGGAADNTGSSIAHRLVLKTGLNIVLACNIPKNSPMLEADAERKLVQKLRSLGYIKPITERSSCTS